MEGFINETIFDNVYDEEYDIPIKLYFIYANRLFALNPQFFFENDRGQLHKISSRILDSTPSYLKNAINVCLELLKIKAFVMISGNGMAALAEVIFTLIRMD